LSSADLEPDFSEHPLPESTTSPELSSLPSSKDETTELGPQVEAAVREVEDLLVESSVAEPVSHQVDIDWRVPDLSALNIASPVETPLETAYEFNNDDEDSVRSHIEAIESRVVDVAAALSDTENAVLQRVEHLTRFRTYVAARRQEEEARLVQLEQEAERQRLEDKETLRNKRAEIHEGEKQVALLRTEEGQLKLELHGLRKKHGQLYERRLRLEEEARLAALLEAQHARDEAEVLHLENLAHVHSEEESLRTGVVTLGVRRRELDDERQRHELEVQELEESKVQFAVAAAARNAEVTRRIHDLEDQAGVVEEQLKTREREVQALMEELARHQTELEKARDKAEANRKRVMEARARMHAAEESSRAAERERLLLEAEIFQRADAEQRLLEETRRRAQEQRRSVEENALHVAEADERRLADLEALRDSLAAASQLREARERKLQAEVESFKLAEEEAVRRIHEFETQRRAASETHKRALERLQRVEEEMRARAAAEARTRSDLELHIKKEMEHLGRLEQESRQRTEGELLRRSEAESRLRQEQERYQCEQEARVEDEPKNDSAVLVPAVEDLGSADPQGRAAAVASLARLGANDAYALVVNCFDDESPVVRNAAARALFELEPQKPVEPFTRALKDASDERRAKIGRAISESGLAAQAVNALNSDNREDTFNALCLLFTMAKTGEIEALVNVVETHDETEVRLAAVRLLTMAGQTEIANAALKRRLQVQKPT
jgi:hypothetical protein